MAAWEHGIDGVSGFFGVRWDAPDTVRLTIRPELLNAAGLLSGVAAFTLVDYCMGSALWRQTAEEEGIATLNITIDYLESATAGEVVCRTSVDRRNRRVAWMRSTVEHEDGRLLATASGTYQIFRRARRGLPRRPAS